jgi:hypothetical protein
LNRIARDIARVQGARRAAELAALRLEETPLAEEAAARRAVARPDDAPGGLAAFWRTARENLGEAGRREAAEAEALRARADGYRATIAGVTAESDSAAFAEVQRAELGLPEVERALVARARRALGGADAGGQALLAGRELDAAWRRFEAARAAARRAAGQPAAGQRGGGAGRAARLARAARARRRRARGAPLLGVAGRGARARRHLSARGHTSGVVRRDRGAGWGMAAAATARAEGAPVPR